MGNRIDLAGRRAIVTGGCSGLGLAIARRLKASGARVEVWDVDAAASTLPDSEDIACTQVDVSVLRDVERAISASQRKLGAIDIFVNNAGITGPNAQLWEYPPESWDRVMQVNVQGTFYCSRAVTPVMLQQNYGRIVNIASVAGKEGNPNASAYSASKAAIIAMTKSLAKELVDTGIRVNCITPAAVETPLFKQMSKEHIDFMLSKIPMQRFGQPEEIAALVAWLCSEECSFSTGAVFDISGGRSTY